MGSRLMSAMAVALHFLLLLLLPVKPRVISSALSGGRHYDVIFSFGDSFTDTGNNPVVFDWYNIPDPVMRPPYGITFFDDFPTGRNCDGRLVIDFIAQNLGLPLVPPYLSHKGSFRQGANFAVGGATALDSSFFHAGDPPGANPFPLNTSLGVQLSWFDSLKPSLCSTTQECKDFFGRSLFFVGEFGINDYHFSFGKRSMQEIRSFVPDIIRTISMAVEKLIGDGATTLVVPGMIPSGCSPPVLVTFADADAAEYDASTGCLKEPNEIATLHNSLLLDAVEELREKHPTSPSYTRICSDACRRWSRIPTSLEEAAAVGGDGGHGRWRRRWRPAVEEAVVVGGGGQGRWRRRPRSVQAAVGEESAAGEAWRRLAMGDEAAVIGAGGGGEPREAATVARRCRRPPPPTPLPSAGTWREGKVEGSRGRLLPSPAAAIARRRRRPSLPRRIWDGREGGGEWRGAAVVDLGFVGT